jgi:hypothetical protein
MILTAHKISRQEHLSGIHVLRRHSQPPHLSGRFQCSHYSDLSRLAPNRLPPRSQRAPK